MIAPTTTQINDAQAQPPRGMIVVFTLLAISTIWFSLGDNPLNGRSEGRYAVVSMNMANGSGWLVPMFMDGPHLTKPPLTYWLEALCLRLFGYCEEALRTPSAVAGSLTILLTLWIGWKLHGPRRGLLAMGVLAMMPMHLVLSRLTLTDSLLGLFWFSTLVFGLLCVEEPDRKRWPALMWLAVALGLLTKGPLAWVPVALVLIWLALARRWREMRRLRVFIGLAVSLIPLLTWVALVWKHHPEASQIWFHEMFARMKGTSDLHPEPIYYFVPIFLGGLFPATLIMNLPGVNYSWPSALESIRKRQREVLWALAVVIPFVMFSLIKGKLASYMLPLCAPMALLASQTLERWLTGEADEIDRGPAPGAGAGARVPWVIEPFAVTMAIGLAATVGGAWHFLGREYVWLAAPILVLLCVSAWGWSVWRRRPELRGAVLALIFVGICGAIMWAGEVEDMVTNPPSNDNLLNRIEAKTGLQRPFNLALVDYKDATLTYYNRRPAPTVLTKELPELARNHTDELIVLVNEQDWRRLEKTKPEITGLFREAMVWAVWPSDMRRLVLRPVGATTQPSE